MGAGMSTISVIEMPFAKGPVLTPDYLKDMAEWAFLPREHGVKILHDIVAHRTAYYDREDKVYRVGCP